MCDVFEKVFSICFILIYMNVKMNREAITVFYLKD